MSDRETPALGHNPCIWPVALMKDHVGLRPPAWWINPLTRQVVLMQQRVGSQSPCIPIWPIHKILALREDHVGSWPISSNIRHAHNNDGCFDWGQGRLALYAMIYIDATDTFSVSYNGIISMNIGCPKCIWNSFIATKNIKKFSKPSMCMEVIANLPKCSP